MKDLNKSQKLREEAQKEDNDLKYMGKMKKVLREERLERFENGYKEKLEANNYIVLPFDGTKVVIDTQIDTFGVIDYFPKANKILIRKRNLWVVGGLKWINNNLLKTK